MRFIKYRPSALNLRTGWNNDAKAVIKQLEEAKNPTERGDIIKNHSGLWSEVKQELSKLSHSKCWYTESKQAGTDTDVDHFRPKRRVSECMTRAHKHPGYWWLAFDLTNYRFSCIYANRRRKDINTDETGGKADHFPVCDESRRAWRPTDNCDDEEPMLLDPCKLADTKLLMFKPDGEAMPRHGKKTDPKKHQRAATSIRLYNLNHSDFVKARLELRNTIEDLLQRAQKYYRKLETEGQTASDAYSEALEGLQELTAESSPYSGFCLEMIKPRRSEDFLDGVALG